ncbi:MAG: V-type ATP synthase subunit I, partial [Thermoplasmata archaeon]|nr:V-type ATP synthase subunit I [Thermoplasmata archaeon]
LFDITGFVGNVLSFSRLLALALATAGLALTINIFVQLIIDIHPAVIIIALLFFIVVHFMNSLIQSLGAGIHSLRLQYVELFSMFYEGGGKPFKPFKAERQWTQIIEKEAKS